MTLNRKERDWLFGIPMTVGGLVVAGKLMPHDLMKHTYTMTVGESTVMVLASFCVGLAMVGVLLIADSFSPD